MARRRPTNAPRVLRASAPLGRFSPPRLSFSPAPRFAAAPAAHRQSPPRLHSCVPTRNTASGTARTVPRRWPPPPAPARSPHDPGTAHPAPLPPSGNAPAARNAKIADPRLVTSALRHQNRLAHHVGVYLVQHRVLLRNAAAVDDPPHRHAVLLHPLQNHARVKRRAFDGREQLVLRRVRQPPAERRRRPVPDSPAPCGRRCPTSAAAARSGRRGNFPGRSKAAATVVPARRAIASKMSPVAESPASIPVLPGWIEPSHHAAHAGDQHRLLA